MQNPLQQLRFKQVELHANGFIYRGQLLGADDQSLYLKTTMRYVSLSMTQVSSIRAADKQETLNKINNIPKNFYLDPALDPPPEIAPEPNTGPGDLTAPGAHKNTQQDLQAKALPPSGSIKDYK